MHANVAISWVPKVVRGCLSLWLRRYAGIQVQMSCTICICWQQMKGTERQTKQFWAMKSDATNTFKISYYQCLTVPLFATVHWSGKTFSPLWNMREKPWRAIEDKQHMWGGGVSQGASALTMAGIFLKIQFPSLGTTDKDLVHSVLNASRPHEIISSYP